MTIETEHEEDGRWLSEVVEIPGVIKRAQALALRVIADKQN